jgi:ornithine cyclodeaminase/alanine dehydrogenase-like protein (mu-crystallin family)
MPRFLGDPDRVGRCQEGSGDRGTHGRVASSFEAAVRGADVVACYTDARKPVIRLQWLRTGGHMSSVGGTLAPELDADTLAAASIYVEWRGAATNAPPAGAHELQGFDVDRGTEPGRGAPGRAPGSPIH